jgi:hypothetical protein
LQPLPWRRGFVARLQRWRRFGQRWRYVAVAEDAAGMPIPRRVQAEKASRQKSEANCAQERAGRTRAERALRSDVDVASSMGFEPIGVAGPSATRQPVRLRTSPVLLRRKASVGISAPVRHAEAGRPYSLTFRSSRTDGARSSVAFMAPTRLHERLAQGSLVPNGRAFLQLRPDLNAISSCANLSECAASARRAPQHGPVWAVAGLRFRTCVCGS